jgi:hypothetical protein
MIVVLNDGDFVDVILLWSTCNLLATITKHQVFRTVRNAVQRIKLDTNLERHLLILLTYCVIMQGINCKTYMRSGVSTEAFLNAWMSGFCHSSWITWPLENEGTGFLRNVGSHVLYDTVSHPRRPEHSVQSPRNILYKVCRTSCTKSTELPVQSLENSVQSLQDTLNKVCRTSCTKSAEHPVQSLQNFLYKVWRTLYKVCRTSCTKSAEHSVQSLQNILYKVCRTFCTKSAEHSVRSLQSILYIVCRTPRT